MKNWKELSKYFIELHTIQDMEQGGKLLKEVMEEMVGEEFVGICSKHQFPPIGEYCRLCDHTDSFNNYRQEMLDKIKKFFE